MRLIGLALVFVLLVGLTQILLDRHDVIAKYFAGSSEDAPIDLVFETPTALMFDSDLSGARVEDIAPTDRSAHRSLKSFPDFAKLNFRLPRSVDVTYGIVHLDLKTRLLESGSGVVVVRINGVKRGEILLQPGTHLINTHIPLEENDLDGPFVEVSLTARGSSHKEVCGQDEGLGVVVDVLPTTRMNATFGKQLGEFSDVLAKAGDPARVIWPETGSPDLQSQLLQLTQNVQADDLAELSFVASGFRMPKDIIVDETFVANAFNEIAPARSERYLHGPDNVNWPVPVLDRPLDTRLRKFASENTWSFNYLHSQMPDGELPGTFQFEMGMSGASRDERYLLYVSLNGALVHSENLAHTENAIRRSVKLPLHRQRLNNTVNVTLVRSEVRTHPCNFPLPIVAQVREGASLWPADTTKTHSSGALLSAVSKASRIELSLDAQLPASRAEDLRKMIADVLGTKKMGVSYAADTSSILGITVQSADDAALYYGTYIHPSVQPVWVVWQTDEGTQLARADDAVTARRLTTGGPEMVMVVRQFEEGI